MPHDDSVTHWLRRLGDGDTAAAQPLWERYFARLVQLAGQNLRGTPRQAADEEDVALSAFASFCRGVAEGRFPQLRDRTNLWDLLVVITARKAIDLARRERRLKRGGGRVTSEAALPDAADSSGLASLIEQIVGREPTPEFAAQVAEEYRRLLDQLGDDSLRQVAVWKMEGLSNDEVAAKLDCSRRTVARKLDTIRIIWSEVTPP